MTGIFIWLGFLLRALALERMICIPEENSSQLASEYQSSGPWEYTARGGAQDTNQPKENPTTPNKSTIESRVEEDFFKKMAREIAVEASETSRIRAWTHEDLPFNGDKIKSASFVRGDLNSCKLVLSKVLPIAPGIFCPATVSACSETHSLAESGMYSLKKGWKVGASVKGKAGFDVMLVKAEIELGLTYERAREYNWQNTTTTTEMYRFNLKGGQHCIPSTVYIELECSAIDSTYYFAFLQKDSSFGQHSRLGVDGYPCIAVRMAGLERKAQLDESTWKTLIEKQPEYGRVYLGRTDAIMSKGTKSAWRLWVKGHSKQGFAEDDPSIHVFPGNDYVFLCPKTVKNELGKMRIPLRSSSDSLFGYVGCL